MFLALLGSAHASSRVETMVGNSIGQSQSLAWIVGIILMLTQTHNTPTLGSFLSEDKGSGGMQGESHEDRGFKSHPRRFSDPFSLYASDLSEMRIV